MKAMLVVAGYEVITALGMYSSISWDIERKVGRVDNDTDE
jgi:hypothetical protein